MERVRFRLFHVLHKPEPDSAVTRNVNYLLAALILINCAAVALESVPAIHTPHRALFSAVEIFSTGLFILRHGETATKHFTSNRPQPSSVPAGRGPRRPLTR